MWEKTQEELSQELSKKQNTEIQKQTEYLGYFLKLVTRAVEENKSVKIENIVRKVVGKVAVERPDWIKELKQDTTPIQKKLDYIASAVIRKEVVREVGLKRPDWLEEIIPREIKFPEQKEAEKLIPIIKEVIKEIKSIEIPDEISIKGQVEIKEPKWLKFPDINKPILALAKFLKGLQEKIFKVEIQNEITLKNPVKEVKILNPQKEVSITNLKELEKDVKLMTAQLQALGNTGSRGGASGGATEAKQDEIIGAINGSSYDTTSIDKSDPSEIVITYLLNSVVVATETITISGSTINIVKS